VSVSIDGEWAQEAWIGRGGGWMAVRGNAESVCRDVIKTYATHHTPRAVPTHSAVRATLAAVGDAFAALFHDAAAAQGRQTGLQATST